MKYIATSKRSKKFEGNVWTKQEDGMYTCPNMPKLKLDQWQIDNDLKFGYLEVIQNLSLPDDGWESYLRHGYKEELEK